MNRFIVYILFFLCVNIMHIDAQSSYVSSSQVPASEDEIVDEVRVTIYDPKGKQILLSSDIRPGLDGSHRTLYDVLLDQLKVLDARNLGIEVTENEADQFLARIQQEHGMTKADIEHVFSELGYTFEEGRQLLRDQQMIERIVDHRVKSDRRMLIQRSDVVAYDEAYPAYISGSYTLQQAYIPAQVASEDKIRSFIQENRIDELAQWEESFTISEDELAPQMQFIDTAEVGTVVDVEATSDGTEVTRLVDKQQRKRIPVEQRYEEIASKLRRQQYNTIQAEYDNRLLRQASLRFTYTSDRDWIYAGVTKENAS